MIQVTKNKIFSPVTVYKLLYNFVLYEKFQIILKTASLPNI